MLRKKSFFFKTHFKIISKFNCTLLNYTEYQEKYRNLSKRQLKKALATLKHQNDDRYTSEIRYISKLIRSKCAKKPDDDEKIAKNFWGFCKEVFEKEDTVKPRFNKGACHSFFKETLRRG